MKTLYATVLYPIIFLSVLFPFNFAGAYSVGTHALLTREIIYFYNNNFPGSKITGDSKDYLIDGSRLEDNTPRYLNHFYDPINDRGLSDGGFRGQKSKDWADDSTAQTAFLYRSLSPSEASILSLAQVEKIKSSFDQSDFTWKKAVSLYADGKIEEALFTLGHIIHLVEDMSVPDHVRNDSHPPYDDGGSPYENWTAKFNLDNPDTSLTYRLTGKSPELSVSLESYFDNLAKYTNENFYSEDSIDSYDMPKLDFKKTEGENIYGFRVDDNGDSYRLVRIFELSKKYAWRDSLRLPDDSLSANSKTLYDGIGNLIMNDYWSRLSVKSVQYGAGVIDLFFKEVEKEKESRKTNVSLPTRYFGQAFDILKDFIPSFNGNRNLNLASVIDLAGYENEPSGNSSDAGNKVPEIGFEFINAQDFNEDDQNEDAVDSVDVKKSEIPEEVIPPVAVPVKKSPQVCVFDTGKSAIRQNLIINEVAWMGGISSANDEWIELRNISGESLDISGWQLLDKGGQIKVSFGNMKVASGAYVLLERTDDNSVLEIKADAVYAGALSNSDEGLRLFDDQCELMDEVLADGDWQAGDAASRRTMERSGDFSWHSYQGSGSARGGISLFGTPKSDNSQPGIANTTPVAISNNSIAVVDLVSSSGPLKILISEVQITGGTGKSDNDFVELYNPNNTKVNLNGYRLVKRTKTGTADISIKSWTMDAYIPAKGYYLWANSGYAGIPAVPDVITSSTLSNDNGIAVRYGPSDTGDIIDSVGWGAADNIFVERSAFRENPAAKQSISRQYEYDTDDNSVDYIKTSPSPKNSSDAGGFIPPAVFSGLGDSSARHILISEVYPDRTGANLDFVELYNPNASGTPATGLEGWSLQILSANATTTDKMAKKNFESGNEIHASGFFLVGIDDFNGGDMSWAGGSLNSVDGATVFLVSGTTTISDFEDSEIIDKISYGSGSGLMSPENIALPLPDIGGSLERKSFAGGICSSSSGIGEYSGNGCDTDDNSADFETRTIFRPQKFSNLNEPRNSPAAPGNISAVYDSSDLTVSLSWGLPADSSGEVSALNYSLQSSTSTNPLKHLSDLSGTSTYSYKISEVGIDYNFSIISKDADGLESASSLVSLTIPSIFDSAYFYPDPLVPGNYKMEFRYDSYPFIYPELADGGFRSAVFYKNQEAPEIPFFYSDIQFSTTPDGVTPKEYGEWGSAVLGAWKLKYENCAGAYSEYTSLILPDKEEYCSPNYGGIRNGSISWNKLEDWNIRVDLSGFQEPPVPGDYFTPAFYVNTGYNTQTLAAVDRRRYYFLDEVPPHSAPSAPDNIEFSYDSRKSVLRMIWDRSSDSDTLDSSLVYELNYGIGDLPGDGWAAVPSASSGPEEAVEIRNRPFTKISVEPDSVYSIAIRAKDDFGNISAATSSSFAVPESVPPYGITDLKWGNIDGSGNLKISFDATAYPFMDTDNSSAMLFFLNQDVPGNHTFKNWDERWTIGGANQVLKLGYAVCDGQFDSLIGGLIMNNQSGCPDGSGLKKYYTRSDFSHGQTSFTTDISGVISGGTSAGREFISDDYVTVGFYGYADGVFILTDSYNKKTYFSE